MKSNILYPPPPPTPTFDLVLVELKASKWNCFSKLTTCWENLFPQPAGQADDQTWWSGWDGPLPMSSTSQMRTIYNRPSSTQKIPRTHIDLPPPRKSLVPKSTFLHPEKSFYPPLAFDHRLPSKNMPSKVPPRRAQTKTSRSPSPRGIPRSEGDGKRRWVSLSPRLLALTKTRVRASTKPNLFQTEAQLGHRLEKILPGHN